MLSPAHPSPCSDSDASGGTGLLFAENELLQTGEFNPVHCM